MVALRAAAAALGTSRLDDCDLWVTLEPCAMCAGAIALARIRRLHFGASDPKGGAVIHGPRLFSQPTCHHAPEIYPGHDEEAAAALLQAFFRERRGQRRNP
jgi:tRNA(adenine34) deaminase